MRFLGGRSVWPWLGVAVVVVFVLLLLVGPVFGGVVGLLDKALDLLAIGIGSPIGRLVTFNIVAIVGLRWFARRNRRAWDRFFGGNVSGATRSLIEAELIGDDERVEAERNRLSSVGEDELSKRLVRAIDAANERARSARSQQNAEGGRRRCTAKLEAEFGAPAELLEQTRSPLALAACARWARDHGRSSLARATAHEVLQQVPGAPDAIAVAVEILASLDPPESVDPGLLQAAIENELDEPLPVFGPASAR